MSTPATGPTTSLYEGRFLRMVQKGGWEFCQRTNAKGVVGILALTEAGEIILIEQHRVPLEAVVIEIPAGLAGDIVGAEDEAWVEAAKRELLEETGFEGDDWTHVGEGTLSAGLTDETMHLFVARGLRRVHGGGGAGDENITVHLIPLVQAAAWLQEQRDLGKKIDTKVMLAIWALGDR